MLAPREIPRRVLSDLWSVASAVTRFGAYHRWLPVTQLPCQVISVGNIQVGGAGKTPLVAQIAREAAERRLSVCILTRGYGGQWEKKGGVLAPQDSADQHSTQAQDPYVVGDEPALLRELAPQAWIAIGADRVQQYRAAAARLGRDFDRVILDDGFQHWKIHKDTQVVAVTSTPREKVFFRDFPRALKRADLIVWTKGAQMPEAVSGKEFVRVKFQLSSAAKGERIFLVTGVGDPRSVEESAREGGYDIVRHERFPDHVVYDKNQALALLEEAKNLNCQVAMTGKDWVKWRALTIPPELVRRLEPELIFEQGREIWDRVIWGAK
jgi:tetraacyldisaccharide 4'-kinase